IAQAKLARRPPQNLRAGTACHFHARSRMFFHFLTGAACLASLPRQFLDASFTGDGAYAMTKPAALPDRACGRAWVGCLVVAGFLALATSTAQTQPTTVRVGHFPNITHVQALVAHHLTRQGKGWFEERLGPGTRVEWFIYNAGPTAMEAIFAHSIDLA